RQDGATRSSTACPMRDTSPTRRGTKAVAWMCKLPMSLLSCLPLLVLALDPCAAPQGVRVSTPLPTLPPDVAGATVGQFQVLPGGSEVISCARHDPADSDTLRVSIDGGPSRPTTLPLFGLPLPFTPDGTRCVYWLSGCTPQFGCIGDLYSQLTDE